MPTRLLATLTWCSHVHACVCVCYECTWLDLGGVHSRRMCGLVSGVFFTICWSTIMVFHIHARLDKVTYLLGDITDPKLLDWIRILIVINFQFTHIWLKFQSCTDCIPFLPVYMGNVIFVFSPALRVQCCPNAHSPNQGYNERMYLSTTVRSKHGLPEDLSRRRYIKGVVSEQHFLVQSAYTTPCPVKDSSPTLLLSSPSHRRVCRVGRRRRRRHHHLFLQLMFFLVASWNRRFSLRPTNLVELGSLEVYLEISSLELGHQPSTMQICGFSVLSQEKTIELSIKLVWAWAEGWT